MAQWVDLEPSLKHAAQAVLSKYGDQMDTLVEIMREIRAIYPHARIKIEFGPDLPTVDLLIEDGGGVRPL